MCPEGFVLGPDWKNCDDVDECAAGDNHNHDDDNDNHVCMICMICICKFCVSNDAL